MELPLIFSITLTILLSIFVIYKRPRHRHRLPPSPGVALPIIGHLHLLKQPLHRTFHRLSQSTGPIFSLKLGFHRAVVVSSPSLVDECFTKNDVALANRPIIIIDKYIGYNHSTMSGAPYGELWRSLRRIAAQEILSGGRLTAFSEIRHDEVKSMLLSLVEKHTLQQKKSLSEKESRGFSEVELRPMLSKLTFNNMMTMLAAKRLDEESEEGRRLRRIINEVFEMAQASNPQDFLPFLQWIDYGGFTKKVAALAEEMDELFQELVDEHRREKRNSMIGHLLELQRSDLTIKGLLMEKKLPSLDIPYGNVMW